MRPSFSHQHVDAAGLVDEVDGARLDRLAFALVASPSGEKSDRQRAALRPQGAQHVEAGHLRQGPVDQHRLGREASLQGGQQGRAIGEVHDRVAAILEVAHHDLAVEVVVIDQDDPGLHRRA